MASPIQIMEYAKRHYPDGEFHQGADLVWQAAYNAIEAAAQQSGMPCRYEAQAYAVAAYLDQRKPDGYEDHSLYLILSDVHRRQANTTDFPSG